MAGKRNEIELYEDRAKIAELMHRGVVSPSELMDKINQGRPAEKHISRQTISNDIDWIKEQYRNSALYDFNMYWHETLAQYNDLLKTTWEEFYSSKTIKVTITTEGHDQVAEDIEEFNNIMSEPKEASAEELLSEARTMKAIIKKEKREGNVAYLQLIEKIIEKIAKMKSVDGTSKIAFTDSKGEDLPSITDGILATLKRISKPIVEEFIEGELAEPELLTDGSNEL